MKNTLSLFINAFITLDRLVDIASEVLELSFVGRILDTGIIYEAHDKANLVEVIIFDNHGLENDCGISFEHYSYEVDFIPLYQSIDNVELTLSNQLQVTLQRIEKVETILVSNFQKLL